MMFNVVGSLLEIPCSGISMMPQTFTGSED